MHIICIIIGTKLYKTFFFLWKNKIKEYMLVLYVVESWIKGLKFIDRTDGLEEDWFDLRVVHILF